MTPRLVLPSPTCQACPHSLRLLRDLPKEREAQGPPCGARSTRPASHQGEVAAGPAGEVWPPVTVRPLAGDVQTPISSDCVFLCVFTFSFTGRFQREGLTQPPQDYRSMKTKEVL